MKNVVVIGGGIAGLSAAYFLLKKSQDLPIHVTLLEADSRWGGKICTEAINGFVIEGGPDCFLAAKPQAVALCRELGLGESLQGTNPDQRKTYILHGGQLLPIPDGLVSMVPTDFQSMAATRLLSWPQKARMALDLTLPPRSAGGDESVGAFVSRRLGRAAYENLIQPLISGIYTGDGDALSLAATFPALREMEQQHGSLIKGAFARKRQTGSGNHSRSAFLTPTAGLATLVEALVASLQKSGADLRLNTSVSRIHPSGALSNYPISNIEYRYLVEMENDSPLDADAVILATPAHVSAGLLAPFDHELASDLRAIPHASTATVSLAYCESDLARALDGYGYVIPRREKRQALACTWTSSKFAGRAPEGQVLLRVFIGRAGQEIPNDETELLAIAQQEVQETLGIHASPILSRVFVWEKAMPQYNLGHPERLARIEAGIQKSPRLALAGNGYKGVGIPDCIHSGEIAAEKIITSLR